MRRTIVYAWLVVPILIVGLGLTAEPSASDYHVLKKIEIGEEGGWDYLTMDSEAQRLYITRGDRVMVLDTDKGTIVGTVPKTSGVHGVALAPQLNRGFTSNGRDGSVTVFDTKSLETVNTIKEVGTNPDGIIYDPATERVFTFNGRSHDATAIDAKTEKVLGKVPLGGKPESAVSDEKGQVFVNLEDKSEVVALDAKELKVLNRWPVAPGKDAVGLAMDRANRRLFVTCGNEKMVVMDADNGKVVATLSIGKGTDYCVFDPEVKSAFSPNRDGTLTVVEEETPDKFKVVANVQTQYGARTCALDTRTHRIYLCTAKFKAAPEGGKAKGRPPMEPGSFVVLVVGK